MYILSGGILVLPIAYRAFFHQREAYDEKFALPFFYALTNITVVSKCPLGDRNDNYRPMKFVSLVWMCYHCLALIILTICYSVDVLPVDVATTRLSDPVLFYSLTSVTLLMGPLSVLSLRWLMDTVKNLKGWNEENQTWSRDLWHNL